MCFCDRPFGIIRQTWRDFETDITVTPVSGYIHGLKNVCRLCDILHGDAGVDIFGRQAVSGEDGDFFERVRAAYRVRAAAEPARFRVLDASRAVDEVRAAACAEIGRFVAATRAGA